MGSTTGNLWVTGANSLIVALIKVPLGLLLAALAAYALARMSPETGLAAPPSRVQPIAAHSRW